METKQNKKESWLQVIKFTLFSISAGLIQIGSFSLFNEVLKLEYWTSYLTSLLLSIIWNFTFNRKFTFKSAANVSLAMLKILGYYAIFTPLTTWGGNALEAIGWNEYLVLGLSMLLNFITEFLFTKYVVYRHQINTALKNNTEESVNESEE